MKISIVGATGLVGRKMIEILEERNFPVDTLNLYASPKKEKRYIDFQNRPVEVKPLSEKTIEKCDIALFAVDSEISFKWAPFFADIGSFVIDNSSAFRMKKHIPLVIPEINIDDISVNSKIIANPNCSTIQMLVALAPLDEKFGLKSIVVSTYQAVSGAGMKGLVEYREQIEKDKKPEKFSRKIFGNAIPQIGKIEENGFCKEELKLVNESRKILGRKNLQIYPTVVRIPVENSHCESVLCEFDQNVSVIDVKEVLSKAEGCKLLEDIFTPLEISGSDDVFVGRIRQITDEPKKIMLWIVADNLRKGAATNAVQIAEKIYEKFIKEN